MRVFACAAAAVATCFSVPATAAWNVAKSKHFVIYANDSAKGLRDFAAWLERFDASVRFAYHMPDPTVGDGNRLTVFVLPKAEDVQALVQDKSGFLQGFYTGRVSGSLVYLAKNPYSDGTPDDQRIFFHEYTHHLMMQETDRPYPEWFVEGFAEFFSSPKFDHDGSVWLGTIPQSRGQGLFYGPRMPVQSLFSGMSTTMSKEQRDVFYGRGWLLTHYLLLSGKRSGQLTKYVQLLTAGTEPLEAARQTFGDFAKLDRELDGYMRGSLVTFKVPASAVQSSTTVEVTPLTAGGAQVISALGKIKYSQHQPMEALATEVRAVEARFPGDELVERALAEAELKTDHPEAAEAAADRALKANPQSAEAMVLKGRALVERAVASNDRSAADALFERARSQFIAANKLDTEDPEPLFEYYETYPREHMQPTANAIAALHYASDLAPQDFNVRMNSAIAYLHEGKFPEAKSALTVVAYSPHAHGAGDMAKRMIADLDAGKGKAALEELRKPSAAQASAD